VVIDPVQSIIYRNAGWFRLFFCCRVLIPESIISTPGISGSPSVYLVWELTSSCMDSRSMGSSATFLRNGSALEIGLGVTTNLLTWWRMAQANAANQTPFPGSVLRSDNSELMDPSNQTRCMLSPYPCWELVAIRAVPTRHLSMFDMYI
jgi:hypothetical protein